MRKPESPQRQPSWRVSHDDLYGWAFERDGQLEVVDAEGTTERRFPLDGRTPMDTLQSALPTWDITQPELEVGQYYPRMWRPGHNCWTPTKTELRARHSAASSARSLLMRLHELFRFVEPVRGNIKAFGHEQRNLLLLACTEVEAAWRGVLNANRYLQKGTQKRKTSERSFTTNDYVQLLEPMRLAEWELRFSQAPELAPVRPFGGWTASAPTRSLPWYDAYNHTKHDREGELRQATLQRAIEAVAAVCVMVTAQFGAWSCVSQADAKLLRIVQEENARELVATLGAFAFERIPRFDQRERYTPPGVLGWKRWSKRYYFK